MKTFLVGFRCPTHRYCSCTAEVPDEEREKFEAEYGFPYSDYCYYDLVEAPSADEITLEVALRQQGATEYETAKELWTEADVIREVKLGGQANE